MKKRILIISLTSVMILAIVAVVPALAHQPFFEEEDIKASQPWEIEDPTISTAVYATLESAQDVDYFAFDGLKGQSILLSLVIPKIDGQENFTPSLALMGPGLDTGSIDQKVSVPAPAGLLVLPPPEGAAKLFFEPFSRTSYWERQKQIVELPADGHYVVAVWNDPGQTGRYTFVIGDREVLGGDLRFPFKMKSYWTPVNHRQPPHSCSSLRF